MCNCKGFFITKLSIHLWSQLQLHVFALRMGWFYVWCCSVDRCMCKRFTNPWRSIPPCRCWLRYLWHTCCSISRCPLSFERVATS
jgi:hypothetical protein